jgi:uncharacterized protein YecT (DUF1311 family)
MILRFPGIVLAAVFLPALAGHSATDDLFKNLNCKTAKTQIEMNYCADRDFKIADAKLNTLYRSLFNSSDQKTQALLKTAERDWIAYRDAECALEAAASEGGSIAPMEYSLCLTEKTAARIRELQRQAN